MKRRRNSNRGGEKHYKNPILEEIDSSLSRIEHEHEYFYSGWKFDKNSKNYDLYSLLKRFRKRIEKATTDSELRSIYEELGLYALFFKNIDPYKMGYDE